MSALCLDLEPSEVRELLTNAAQVCGLPEGEAADAISHGLAKGADEPLKLENADTAQITFTRSPKRPKSRSSRVHNRMRGWSRGRA